MLGDKNGSSKEKNGVSRKGLRHAGQHHKLYAKSVIKCPTTGEFTLPHRVSQVDGTKTQKFLKQELISKQEKSKKRHLLNKLYLV